MSSLRIVSLVPSITELLIAVGLGPALVGRTGFCIHPADAVRDIPKMGGTKAVNLDKIRALAPSHVIVNVDENEKPTVDALRQWVPYVVVTHPQTPADNIALIDQLCTAFAPFLNAQIAPDLIAAPAIFQRAGDLKDHISRRLDKLRALQAGRAPCKVLYLIWREPWMSVAQDTYISQMLALIGWQTLPAVQGGDGLTAPGAARYPTLQGNEAWLGDVQRVLLSSEPYCFGPQHVREVAQWLPQAKVQLVDGEMLSWYGSRAVQGLDYLATLPEEEPSDALPSPS